MPKIEKLYNIHQSFDEDGPYWTVVDKGYVTELVPDTDEHDEVYLQIKKNQGINILPHFTTVPLVKFSELSEAVKERDYIEKNIGFLEKLPFKATGYNNRQIQYINDKKEKKEWKIRRKLWQENHTLNH